MHCTGAKKRTVFALLCVQCTAEGAGRAKRWPGKIVSKTAETGMAQPSRFLFSVFSVLCSRLRFQRLPARIVYHSRPVPVHGSAILSPLYSRSVPRPQRHLSEGSTVHHCLPSDRSASEENANGLILTPALTMFSAQTSEETSRFLHDACLRGAAGAWAVRNHPFSMLSLRPF